MFKDLDMDFDLFGFPSRVADILRHEKSVNAFAKKSGVTEGTLRNYLKGKTKPTRSNVEAIARAGSVSLSWLLSGKGDKQAPSTDIAPLTNAQSDLLQKILLDLAKLEADTHTTLTPEKRARLVVTAFDNASRFGADDMRHLFDLVSS